MNLRDFYSNLRSSDFARSVIVLAGGTAIAQAVSLLALPLITRLYTPEDFSLLALYVAVVQTVSVAACLRLELALPLPKDDEDAVNLLVLAMLAACVVASLVGIVLLIFKGQVARLLGLGTYSGILWLVPLGVLLTGLYNALQFWAIRRKEFPLVAKTRLTQSISAALAQLTLGVAKIAPLGLLVGQIFQSGAGVARLARHAYVHNRATESTISRKKMWAMGREYQQFPRYSVAEALAQSSGMQIPIVIIAALSIGPEAGFLMLAMRAMHAPISLIGSAVSQVFVSSAPEAHRDNSLADLTRRTLGGLLRSVVGPSLFVAILAPQLFSIVFGPEWQRAGELARWLTPLLIVQNMASSIGTTLYVTNNQKMALLVQLSGAIIRIGLVVVAAGWAISWISEVYALAGIAFYTIYLYAGMRCAGMSIRSLLKEFRGALPILSIWVIAGMAVLYIFIGGEPNLT